MTLDMELKVPEYDATLTYHSIRPPNEAMVKRLCESLDLAREILTFLMTCLRTPLHEQKELLTVLQFSVSSAGFAGGSPTP
jgi:hypothetical protein